MSGAPYLSQAAAALARMVGDLAAGLRERPAAPAAVAGEARGWLSLAGYPHHPRCRLRSV